MYSVQAKHILLRLLLIVSILSASDYTGTIYDIETQQALTNVNISIESLEIGTASDKNGYFTIQNLPMGNYQVVISVIGYQKIYYELNNLADQKNYKDYSLILS